MDVEKRTKLSPKEAPSYFSFEVRDFLSDYVMRGSVPAGFSGDQKPLQTPGWDQR